MSFLTSGLTSAVLVVTAQSGVDQHDMNQFTENFSVVDAECGPEPGSVSIWCQTSPTRGSGESQDHNWQGEHMLVIVMSSAGTRYK
ncbi:MAG: hypothetical protein RIQ81_1381 [Pseudomonadota bacterium]|jgi:hypothetical protein